MHRYCNHQTGNIDIILAQVTEHLRPPSIHRTSCILYPEKYTIHATINKNTGSGKTNVNVIENANVSLSG